MNVRMSTDFLYARPSFWDGWARILDFGDTLTEYNMTLDQDYFALKSDWSVVGDDIFEAYRVIVRDEEQKARA